MATTLTQSAVQTPQMNTFLLSVSILISLTAVTTGQLDAPNSPDPERDDCIQAAICNLIKGDLMIEIEGGPGRFYDLAIGNLNKSMMYKNCGLESIFEHCGVSRLKCESDINHLAMNSLRIPMDLLIKCPYTTWPFMLFNCENYGNWPKMANQMIPKICRSCQTQCYLVDEFEAFQQKKGLTDFPPKWDIVKNISRLIKSQMKSVEKRHGASFIYPWTDLPERDPSEVVGTRNSRQSDVVGVLANMIVCPDNHLIDVVEEQFDVIRGTPFGNWHYSKLRFGCTPLASKSTATQRWTNELGGSPSKTTDCHTSAGNGFVVGMRIISTFGSGSQNITWQFTCGSNEEKSRDPTHCPKYTAACSVALAYYAVPGAPVNGLQFGCCALPGILKECNDNPVLTIENDQSGVACKPLAGTELKNCTYNSYYGISFRTSLDTGDKITTKALEYADIFERIMLTYGPRDMNVRDRLDWVNVPRMANNFMIMEKSFEIVPLTTNYTRWQPKIKCGNYTIRSRGKVNNFVTKHVDIKQEYLKTLDEGCGAALLTFTRDKRCVSATTCKFPTTFVPCQICNVTLEYGLFQYESVNITPGEAKNLYNHILNSYKNTNPPADTHGWVNVPETLRKNNETIMIFNVEGEVANGIVQPVIACKSGAIVAKNTIEKIGFNGKVTARYFRNGFIDTIKDVLGCVPVYDEMEVDHEKDCVLSGGKTFNSQPILKCTFSHSFGYELGPGVVELIDVSKAKLLKIAEIAEKMQNNARFYKWTAVAGTPKTSGIFTNSAIKSTHAFPMRPFLFSLIPTITCGDYKLYANYVNDIRCIPTYTIGLTSRPPVCTGCTQHRSLKFLTRANVHLAYTGCNASTECTSQLRFGLGTDGSEEESGNILDFLLSIAPTHTPADHREPGVPFDWETDARTTTNERHFHNVTVPLFDRVYSTPIITCRPYSIYSSKITYTLIKDIV